ncbi:hypothetical protein ZYGR_0I02960 [Zygosaccharomyces rouxii]|uniref:sphingosine kinase n=2 Tax=Zygosaccharomyces rouxii TaxID=4956 RepID=C5DTB4_ZYGRC|nr:uncharacterized protein ZYRO0C07084g [Zygosaccharomyces rouxii]KAH9201795.1 ATP-NAD kinase-like domain-containing protein [Zygosaccharomyces rouxii]GAV48000.1 hypothetical protein ZYGR_0I02960 [Zygosaccharomyces rouxii]CAR27025.1 ZYRO0C07084p [Zygosaccharomyces rouxii]
MDLPPSSPKTLSSIKDRSFNRATLTDDGIMITSQGHCTADGECGDLQSKHFHGCNHSTGSFQSSPSSCFETTSLISCVTCLSDNNSVEHRNRRHSNHSIDTAGLLNEDLDEIPYSSVNGKLMVNTVIPYGRILYAKYLENPNGYTDNSGPASPNRSTDNTPQSKDPDAVNVHGLQTKSDDDLIEEQLLNDDDNRDTPVTTTNAEDGESYHLIEITFAKPRRHDVVPKRLTLLISHFSSSPETNVVEEIMRRSYKNAKINRSVLVIINPHGGQGKAKKLFMTKCRPILLASRCPIEIAYTKYGRHAVDIAREVDLNKYDTIACASGDGIPYEVINGLYQRKDRAAAFNKLSITQLPCGSGNAMSVTCHWTSNPSYAALSLVKSVESRIDLMCCSQPSYCKEFSRLSFLSQCYGIIAESDINTEFIRWLGPTRFELGVAFNIIQRKKYPCDVWVKYVAKSKDDVKVHYLEQKKKTRTELEAYFDDNSQLEETTNTRVSDYETTEEDFKLKFPLEDGVPDDWEKLDSSLTDNLGIFYTGKMPYMAADAKFFPAALPNDGAMDLMVTDARTPVTRIAPILLALDKGTHVLQPEVIHTKILAYKIIPRVQSSLFSVDGERFPLEPLQVEVLPKICKTLLRNGTYVDTEFETM